MATINRNNSLHNNNNYHSTRSTINTISGNLENMNINTSNAPSQSTQAPPSYDFVVKTATTDHQGKIN
jgi:hypothetical protein